MKALAVAVLWVLLAGCATTPAATSEPPRATSDSRPNLTVSNMTTLTVTLVVNGQRVGDFPPGVAGPKIDVTALPALPWTVEARSSSGRVLTSMRVIAAETQVADPSVHIIPMGRVDLSCGRLTIFAGDVAPSGPVPAASEGSPGDCVP